VGLDTITNLIDSLRASQLLTAQQLQDIEQHSFRQLDKPVELARELVSRGWITRYQAQQLMQGHGSELVLGAYRLLERLGEGGMGQVYKALHQPMNRIVALKIVRSELLEDPRTLKRFRREVQAAAKLKHPNIITVFDAAQAGDTHFLAMEYIDGADLAEIVRESGPLLVATACDYIRQAALGLQHAHERGMVHRDIKPSNLLVTRSRPVGVVKILDMGLARPVKTEFFDQPQQTAVTIDGTVVGTPDFMAPEQAKSSNSVDHRADIYSLGCTLYYLLTARLPFPEVTPMEKLIKHQLEEPYPVEMIRGDVPAQLLAALRSMLVKNPDERMQTAAEVAAALEPFCGHEAPQGEQTLASAPSKLPSPSPQFPVPVSVATAVASPFDFDSDAESVAATEPAPAARNRRPTALLFCSIGGLVVLGSALGLTLALGGSRTRPTPTTATHISVPEPVVAPQSAEELLAASIMDDASTVFAIRLGPLLQAPSVQPHARQALTPVIQFLLAVHVDPYKQIDRLIVSTSRDNPEHFLAAVLGDYLTPDFRKVLETKLIPEEITWPDRTTDFIYRLPNSQKGQTNYLAILPQKFVAVASDRALLQKAYTRFQDRKRIGANDTLRKLLAGTKSDASIRMAAVPQLILGDRSLEQLGIVSVAGEAQFTDEMHYHFQVTVKDVQIFRQVKEQLTRALAMKALFDPQQILLTLIFTNAQIEVKSPKSEAHTVELTGKLTQKELNRALPPLFQPWQKR
jgi:serine/threonine protein kinase